VIKHYSRVDPEKLLHIVCRSTDEEEEDDPRIDVIPAEQQLQLAILNYEKGKTFVAHKHIYKKVPSQAIAQESWVVMSGKVRAYLYDLNDEIIAIEDLEAGDVSITLFGGHNYEIVEEGTRVLEYKTGPYYGQSEDKVFLDG
tara:strand:+ start:12653 stop:13078 length:426 start_codon:yes stop_codon:yes gene_type:complete